MRLISKFACLTMLASTAAFAYGGGNHYWDEGHRTYKPSHTRGCDLRLVSIYQPEGGSQPIHLKIKNVSKNRLQYSLQLNVDGEDAGSFSVDNIQPDETNDRDSNKRYPGNLGPSKITITITSCSIRS